MQDRSSSQPQASFKSSTIQRSSRRRKEPLSTYIQNEMIIGLVVSFLLVPQSIAYSFIGNIEPTVGIHASWMLGVICSLFGGRPAMINGITGGFSSMIGQFVEKPEDMKNSGDGIVTAFMSVIFAGVVICLAAALRVGHLNNLIPSTVKIGFCNGLGLIIAKGQIGSFKDNKGHFISGVTLYLVIFYALMSAIIMDKFGKIPLKICKKIPPSLVALIVCILLEFVIARPFGARTFTIGDIATISSENAFPKPFFLNSVYNVSSELNASGVIRKIISQGLSLAALAIMETLMTMEIVNEFTKTEGDVDKQFWALGLGNIVCGLMGASGGDAMIGVTTVNCVGGGRGRLSSFTAALMTMIIIMGAYPLLNFIPLGALIGMMAIVVYRTFRWFTLKAFLSCFMPMQLRDRLGFHNKMDRFDLAVIVIVSILTVVSSLLTACLIGIAIAAIVFTTKIAGKMKISSRIITVDKKTSGRPKTIKIYSVSGPVFFGTKLEFVRHFNVLEDPEQVQVHFEEDSYFDYTIIEALNVLSKRYKDVKKKMKVQQLKESQHLIEKAYNLVKNIEFTVGDEISMEEVPHPITFAGEIDVKDVYHDKSDEEEEQEHETEKDIEMPLINGKAEIGEKKY